MRTRRLVRMLCLLIALWIPAETGFGLTPSSANRERLRKFEKIVAQASQARRRGAYGEAAEQLREAYRVNEIEFNKRNLGAQLARILEQQKTQSRKRVKRGNAVAANTASRPKSGAANSTDVGKSKNRPVRETELVKQVPDRNAHDRKKLRWAVFAAYKGEAVEAIRQLELLSASWSPSAELESAIGVAYARLSCLTTDSNEQATLRQRASEHFRLASTLDPGQRLNTRLVAPQIVEIFSSVAR